MPTASSGAGAGRAGRRGGGAAAAEGGHCLCEAGRKAAGELGEEFLFVVVLLVQVTLDEALREAAAALKKRRVGQSKDVVKAK